MGIIKIGDYVEAANGSGEMGYLKRVKNGNPNTYHIEVKDGIYLCHAVKHVLKQRELEKKMCEAAGLKFGENL